MWKRTRKETGRVAEARRREAGREILLEELEPRILFSTFTVTNTFDPTFLTIPGTLRWAIESANANPGFDTIDFDIGSGGEQTIDINTELPSITGPTLIDATTQGGYAGDPLIVLDGSGAGFSSDGLRLMGDGITVRGLVIQNFGDHGITVYGDNNVIEYNHIGVGADGVSAEGNGRDGIHAEMASGTIIRGNVIGSNFESGIDLSEAGTHNTVVQGNWIGTDKTGTVNLGNHYHGVHITDSLFSGESEDNTIGGTGSGEGNVIAFNREDGVHVNNADRNEIRGNAIYENNSLAIDHEGTGNENLAAPVILGGSRGDATTTRALGHYSGAANSTYYIDFFSNPDSDYEGRVYLGSTTVVTDGSGYTDFDVTLDAPVQVGDYLNATATDSSGNTSEFAVSQLVNMAPTANDDLYSVQRGGVLLQGAPGVLGNDSDPEGDAMNAVLLSDVSHGVLSLAADGSFTYTHDGVGLLSDSFTYEAFTPGGASSVATVTISVTPQSPPVAADDPDIPGAYTTDEDTVLVVDAASGVLSNDIDADLDPLTVQSVDTSATLGSVTMNADGSFSYDPAGAFEHLASGETQNDTFQYTASDGKGGIDTATVTVVVAGVNDAPTAVDNEVLLGEDTGTPVDGNLITDNDGLGHDSDPDDSDILTVAGVDGVTDPATNIVGSYGILDWAADGSYSYSLDTASPAVQGLKPGETATDVFSYTLDDGNGGTDTAVLTVTVLGLNDAPVATANTRSIAEDTGVPVSGNLLSDDDGSGVDADADVGDSLAVSEIDGVTSALIDVTGTYGSLDWSSNGDYSYTLDSGNPAVQALAIGETLTDVFTYTVEDDTSATDTATLTISITGSNDGPTARANVNATSEDAVAPVSGNVIVDDDGWGVDTDPDGSDVLSVSGVDGVMDPATDVVGSYGTLDWGADGSYSYSVDGGNAAVQALAVGETLTEVFTYSVTDGHGGSDTATLTISISGSNDAPVATDNLAAAMEDGGPVGGNLLLDDDGFGLDADIDNGDLVQVTSVQGATDSSEPVAGTYGSLQWAADGGWTYTVDNAKAAVQGLGAGQSVSEAFTYTIEDAAGSKDSGLLTVTVNGTNDAPMVIGGLSFSVDWSAPAGTVVGQLQVVDADQGDVLQYQLVGGVGESAFSVEPATGIIRYLGLEALDAGTTSNGTATLNVAVTDSGGAPPVTGLVNVDLQGSFRLDDIPDPDATPEPVDAPGLPSGTTPSTPVVSTEPPLLVAAPPAAEPETLLDAASDGGRLHFSKLDVRSLTFLSGADTEQQLAVEECDDAAHQSLAPAADSPSPVLSAPQLPDVIDQAAAAQERAERVHASAAATAVLALSAGFITFVLRAGSLFTALLASLPVWHRLDVLSVLALSEEERREREVLIAREEEAELQENEALARLFGELAGPHDDRASPPA